MDPIGGAADIIVAVVVWAAGYLLILRVAGRLSISVPRSLVLYSWHSMMSLVYLYYVLEYGGDTIAYFRASKSEDLAFDVGTDAVRYFTSLFSSTLGFSILNVSLVFNIIGSLGLLAFDASLRHAVQKKGRLIRNIVVVVIFLPSVSFWSSGIGKDAIAFMAATFGLWAALNLKRRYMMMAVAVVTMLLVRPHIAALMALSIAVSTAFQSTGKVTWRIAAVVAASIGAAVIVPFAIQYTGLGDQPDLEKYIEQRQEYNLSGGGAVDISEMALPMQLFTYLYRPLPFEAHSIPALAASIDNVILLTLTIVGINGYLRGRRPRVGVDVTFLWLYVSSALFILAVTTANLGISVRQKWMFVPMLLYLLISVAGRSRQAGYQPLLGSNQISLAIDKGSAEKPPRGLL